MDGFLVMTEYKAFSLEKVEELAELMILLVSLMKSLGEDFRSTQLRLSGRK